MKTNKKTMEIPKNAEATNETPVGVENKNQSLILVKKKLSIAEKLDKIQSFDAVHGRYDYLTERKIKIFNLIINALN